ncbi:hypothetical protein DEJ36_04400 [Curtobacterium sp. MCPF17_052]|nr:hypothetical protein [Curtobacterium sp. MCPF17_052]WIB13855.1 hypothetical protein DEJ36_04400 [Curtobacterium sp. MCPF17_052]
MLDLARLTALAAEARTESRGAHARTDHPETDPIAPVTIAWVTAAPGPTGTVVPSGAAGLEPLRPSARQGALA